MSDLEQQYYGWLCHMVCKGVRIRYSTYTKLLYFLYNTPFEYKLDMDYYRAQDGINLRYQFGKECHIDPEDVSGYLTDKFCTVLEMFISVAIRIDYILRDPDGDSTVGAWFWEIIDNLELDQYSDSTFDEKAVSRIVRNLLNRDYTHEGVGGMFPIIGIKTDMRNVDIWYQAMWYLNNELGPREATM